MISKYLFAHAARAAPIAHKAHGVVHRCESCAHFVYMWLASIGSLHYKTAAAVTAVTIVIGYVLHWIVSVATTAE